MNEDVNISSSGKRVSSTKSEEQEARLKAIEERKLADGAVADEVAAIEEAEAKAAEEKRQAEKKAAEEAEAQAREASEVRREAVEKIGGAAVLAGGAIATAAVKNASKNGQKSTLKTVLYTVLAIAIIALLLFIAWPRLSEMLSPQPETHVAAELSEGAIMNTTAADISSAILGEARQKQELVVWEQDVQVDSKITKALANLSAFAKTKTIHSYGTGVFTVNMGAVDEEAIDVNKKKRTVTISIPHAQLQYITKDLAKTEFEDTEHAVLGFGDVKLTQEQQNLLEQSIEDAMRDELESEGCLADADRAALLVVYDVYQPLITQVDSSYKLDVKFAESA